MDAVQEARDWFTNPRTGEWILDSEEPRIVKALVEEVEMHRARAAAHNEEA